MRIVQPRMNIFSLPTEILLKIFSYIGTTVILRHTCGFFNRIISSQKLLNVNPNMYIRNDHYLPELFKYSDFIRWMTEHGYYRGNRLFVGIFKYGTAKDLDWALDNCYCQITQETNMLLVGCDGAHKLSEKIAVIKKYKKLYTKK